MRRFRVLVKGLQKNNAEKKQDVLDKITGANKDESNFIGLLKRAISKKKNER